MKFPPCSRKPTPKGLGAPRAAFWQFLRGSGMPAHPRLWEGYQKWRARSHEDFAIFLRDCRGKRQAAQKAMAALDTHLPNATKGRPYEARLALPASVLSYELRGLEAAGLSIAHNPEGNACVISGIPASPGEYELPFFWTYEGWISGLPLLGRSFRLLVNPDPAELWRQIPSDQTAEYARPDAGFAMLANGGARIWAASQRGRSHAHNGLPRDDAFALACLDEWLIMAVADGAGSAGYSRKGAELACQTAVDACRARLASAAGLTGLFQALTRESQPSGWLRTAKKLAYHILPHAAFEANKAIRSEAAAKNREAREYATTLLLCATRHFSAGWAIISFQIGDGAMGLLATNGATLLAMPDEGEFGGETRFITMNEIFEANELMQRLQVRLVPDLQGLLLMTDGVSDAFMPGMDNLNDPQKWLNLWAELLACCSAPDAGGNLLQWLNFWSRGNHDDRTIAILATI